ncbi:antA/AntB antirepressor family protein [Providencia stuartii]|uniref:antA/AntB antirepressor family protein n=1 Tax=Providencia stuartii TaxID=588 RepID=UPI00076B482A|nr:antA/AntB antirepressor family protein [Providencia stuartii]AMG66536.1 phage antirepressor Ant [Providencia stuartii]
MKAKNMAITGQGFSQPENELIDTFDYLIPVINNSINGKEIQTVSSRKLHSFLKVGRDYTSWIKGRIKQYGFVENIDYIVVDNRSSPKRESSKFRQQFEHDYVVSLNMGKELSMAERNDQGKLARQYFIECEERLRRAAPEEHEAVMQNWRKNRVTACEEHKNMAEAMKGYIERTGDNQKGFAYSNESRFINKLVLGVDPTKWAKSKGIKSKEIRDNMSADQLKLLAYLEARNCAFLDIDTPSIQRKAQLIELAQRWLVKLMEEK